ncbi:hypothetical protein BKH46_05915 [Helicobacter sp. 12S02634-8]|uniref:outer membrane protein n=1 Tax=Helicobacter sp. 12S02634-8 TaxID=1476199 RepID=UPI000BA6EE37|nr:outer membrane protein [Helicobacter sp. 12S02634-8]PAF46972.1 hypothetical protein BKH46_05915 [Helicobacter sp. 12S02634-8]
MKKVIFGTLCALASISVGVAEESGVFAGVSYQGGQVHLRENYGGFASMRGTHIPNSDFDENYNKNPMINGAGLKLGYKQFFGESKHFGLRYYAFLDYGYANFGAIIPKKGKDGTTAYDDYYTHMLSYGVGVDALLNLIEKDNASFGVFVGVGVGADTWIASGKDFQKQFFPNGKVSMVNFQTTIDAGLRTNIYQHHGFEIGVKVPLLQDNIFSDKDDNVQPEPVAMMTMHNQTRIKRDYSVYVSYLYTF